MFRDREDAGHRLATVLRKRELREPVVLAIPCGGVPVGAVLASELDTELDVVLAAKLRAPGRPELSIGAVSEDGEVILNHFAKKAAGCTDKYLVAERHHQLEQLAGFKDAFRADRPAVSVTGRSVILTDDGIGTGSTILAALQTVKHWHPHEVIVAVPVASVECFESLDTIRKACDGFVCLHKPTQFWSVEDFYADFTLVTIEHAVDLLQSQYRSAMRV